MTREMVLIGDADYPRHAPQSALPECTPLHPGSLRPNNLAPQSRYESIRP